MNVLGPEGSNPCAVCGCVLSRKMLLNLSFYCVHLLVYMNDCKDIAQDERY